MDIEKKLQEIFNDDPFNLLNVKPSYVSMDASKKLVDSFTEIVDFVTKNGREPLANGGVQEHSLYARLEGMRNDLVKRNTLSSYDSIGLLQSMQKEITSFDDLLNDDSFGLLGDDSLGLFDLKHVKPVDQVRSETDFVAKRKVCTHFDDYEQLFRDCHKTLKNGTRRLVKFHENQIQEGAFFNLNGLLVYVEKLIDITTDKFGKRDGRTKLIFENGTESNMLFRSLGKGLFQNGQGITFTNEEVNNQFLSEHNGVTYNDIQSGYIYILKSKSENPQIKGLKHLYKIGFSTTSVEERIKNATQEPTYLMADISIVMTFTCYNIKTHKLEQILHNFFGSWCLNLDVYDKIGNRHTPREWFIAPLSIIEEAVAMIISGEIIHYKYDGENESIVER